MKISVAFILFLILLNPVVNAQNSSFIFKTNSLKNYFPAYIGNGNFSLSTTRRGTDPSQSYMARVYDHGKDDIPRIAKLPAWNTIDLFNGSNWLNNSPIDASHLDSFQQKINMFDGVIETKYNWKDGEKVTKINIQTFVSRENPNAAAIKFTFTPEFTGKVKLSISLLGWNEPKRKPLAILKHVAPVPRGHWPSYWYSGYMKVMELKADIKNDTSLFLLSKADGRETSVAEVSSFELDPDFGNYRLNSVKDKKRAAIEIEFNAVKNKAYKLYKFISVVSSKETPDYIQKSKNDLKTIKEKGYDELFNENKNEWARLWQTDIIIKGNRELQKIVHSNMFYLLCSIREGSGFSISPMGLSTSGYFGHIFWDADTFIFPALLIMHPDMAESMVNFRFKALNAAKANAKLNGYKGAMYPWESDEIGNESTPRFAYQNALHENHITGDVALAQWQYYLATGNKKWLADTGYSVIKGTADFWISRVSFNKKKNRYEIKNVVSVDEGKVGINNDTYTNSIAKKNLEIAIEAGKILDKRINPEWTKVKDKIYIPYDSVNQIYHTYENAPDSILGSVVTLLSYPIGVNMSETTKMNNLKDAAKLVKKKGPGAMMTITLLPIIAAAVQDTNLLNELAVISYKPYLHSPYNVLTETPHNHSINFLTGAGGFLQQVIYGYTGLRITRHGVNQKFKPLLPQNIKELTLQNFYIRGKKYNIIVRGDSLEFMQEGKIN